MKLTTALVLFVIASLGAVFYAWRWETVTPPEYGGHMSHQSIDVCPALKNAQFAPIMNECESALAWGFAPHTGPQGPR